MREICNALCVHVDGIYARTFARNSIENECYDARICHGKFAGSHGH